MSVHEMHKLCIAYRAPVTVYGIAYRASVLSFFLETDPEYHMSPCCHIMPSCVPSLSVSLLSRVSLESLLSHNTLAGGKASIRHQHSWACAHGWLGGHSLWFVFVHVGMYVPCFRARMTQMAQMDIIKLIVFHALTCDCSRHSAQKRACADVQAQEVCLR